MHSRKSALLSSAYFGPIQYYSKFLVHQQRIIEVHDHYTKQTYRNRCIIYGANGLLSLSIPVLKGPAHKSLFKDIRMDDSKNWKKLHWKSIESAYMHSPFFEYYMDEIQAFFTKTYKYLLDLNTDILSTMLTHLEIEPTFAITDEFIPPSWNQSDDYRDIIHPKIELSADPDFHPYPYQQVFSEKHGLLPNLSIMDLLFNEGPNSRNILERSVSNEKGASA
jgi:hypothetical protein